MLFIQGVAVDAGDRPVVLDVGEKRAADRLHGRGQARPRARAIAETATTPALPCGLLARDERHDLFDRLTFKAEIAGFRPWSKKFRFVSAPAICTTASMVGVATPATLPSDDHADEARADVGDEESVPERIRRGGVTVMRYGIRLHAPMERASLRLYVVSSHWKTSGPWIP